MTTESSGERAGMSFAPRVWRDRLWIRIACVAQALGWLALLGILPASEMGVVAWAGLATFVLVVPLLAVRPRIRLGADRGLRLRGWVRSRETTVAQIKRLAMTEYGLRFSFADGSHFTSVVFQATRHVRRPRVLEFVEAIALGRDMPSYDPWDALRPGGIELYSASRSDPPS